MVAPLYTTDSGLLFHAGKILIVLVGLPARGKTHISRSIDRYLRWMGIKTQVISLGDYRRKMLGGAQKLPQDYFTLGHKSSETVALRERIQNGCEETIFEFFRAGGQVAIYDANNGTQAARNRVAEKFSKENIHIILLESICTNQDIIAGNIRSVKISSPDYRGWNPDEAFKDYLRRISDHEQYYETIEEKTWPSIRIVNVGEKIMVNQIHGYLQSRIIFFLMNIHNRFRTIWFARSGQSLIEHSYRADSDLSPAGWDYANALKDFLLQRRRKNLEARGLDPEARKLVIWTSSRRRAHHTAWPFLTEAASAANEAQLKANQIPHPLSHSLLPVPDISGLPGNGTTPLASGTATPSSNTVSRMDSPIGHIKVVQKTQMLEINPGIWDGLNVAQTKKYYPEDWERFSNDPYAYRVPRAESYHDLSVRLEPCLLELEREQEDLLIIGHASVIRCMLAYLIGLPASEIPTVEIARGDLIEVVPASYGVGTKAYHFWDGPGRRGDEDDVGGNRDENNFYENYAEDTKGKRVVDSSGKSVASASPNLF